MSAPAKPRPAVIDLDAWRMAHGRHVPGQVVPLRPAPRRPMAVRLEDLERAARRLADIRYWSVEIAAGALVALLFWLLLRGGLY